MSHIEAPVQLDMAALAAMPPVDAAVLALGPVEVQAMAEAAREEGDLLAACQLATALTETWPTHQMGWELLHDLYWKLEEDTIALSILRRAIRILGPRVELMNRMGVHCHELGETETAVEAFRAAIAPMRDTFLNLAQCLMGRGEHHEAQELLRVVVRQSPLDLEARCMMARSAQAMKDKGLALASLEAAKRIDAEDLQVARLERDLMMAS